VDDKLALHDLTPEDAVRAEHQEQATALAAMGNTITSLRFCSTLDWTLYFERVSLVEQILHRDPAGVYKRMDFSTRDRYRQAVEELAEPNGEAQVRVALRAIESAVEAQERDPHNDRSRHVGFHLLGKGREKLEVDVAWQPTLRRRLAAFVFAHATALYLGSIGLLTLLGALAAAWAVRGTNYPLVAGLLALFPASDLAVSIVQWIVTKSIRPRPLPRLDLSGGVPAEGRTMVIIPTLLTSPDDVQGLMEHLEVQAIGNMDPHIHFAILSDFVDAPSAEMPQDAAILDTARRGIQSLNARYAQGRDDRFFLFHRARLWNPRKPLDGLGAQAAARSRSSTASCRGAGDTELLDAGRRRVDLARRSASASRSTAIRGCRATPRSSSSASSSIRSTGRSSTSARAASRKATASSAARQRDLRQRRRLALLPRLRGAHRRRPLHDAGLRHLPGPLRRGSYTGKGLYDVGRRSWRPRRPHPGERAALARPLRGALRATALVSDIEVVDDYPASVVAHMHAASTAGCAATGRSSRALPLGADDGGATRQTGCPSSAALWKIFDNLRRSLVSPLMLLLLGAGWTVFPGPAWAWTLGRPGDPGVPGLPAAPSLIGIPSAPAADPRLALVRAARGARHRPGAVPRDLTSSSTRRPAWSTRSS
jgi:cyclic beta-1,2-glucan synthetase